MVLSNPWQNITNKETASNGGRKVTTANLQYLGEGLQNILSYCFSILLRILKF